MSASVEPLLKIEVFRNEAGIDAECLSPHVFLTSDEAAKVVLLLDAAAASARTYLSPYLAGSNLPESARMKDHDNAVFRACICDWVMDALDGKDMSDFADSFPEVHKAKLAYEALKREEKRAS